MEMNSSTENVTSEPDGHEEDKIVVEIGDLSDFVYRRVLSDIQDRKTIFLEGTFVNKPGVAVLLLEKEHFTEEGIKTLFCETVQEKVFQNDIYSSFRYFPKVCCNGVKITSIYPANEKHIQKYSYQSVHLINESPHIYKTITLPGLQEEQFSLQWVYNILEHKQETDRIIFEDEDSEIGFILLPDLKWDGKTLQMLHLLALPMKRGILSLRDLTYKELPLLNNIYSRGLKAIEEKYSIPASKLRVHLHYQPSFYHLHVHFTYIQYAAPGISAEKSHLLTTVIDNINLIPNYYQLATIPFLIQENDTLFPKYELAGLVKREEAGI